MKYFKKSNYTADGNDRSLKNVKIVVSLKYLQFLAIIRKAYDQL